MFAFRRLPINTVVRSLRASTINPIISSNTSSIYSSVSTTSSSSFIVSRNMNFITDMISRVTTKTIDSTKEKSFNKMLDLMLDEKDWTLNAWKKMIDNQLNSWMMYIPGVASGKESDELKKIKGFLDAMTPEELNDYTKIDGKAKARIASATNSTIDDVNMAIFMFKNTIVIQKWVHLKKDSNETMPTTDVQMHKMMISDARLKKISMDVMKPSKKTGRGRSLFK